MPARGKNGRFIKGGARRASSRSSSRAIVRRGSYAPAKRSRRRSGGGGGGLMPSRYDLETYGGAGAYGVMEASFVAGDGGMGAQLLDKVPKLVDGAGLAGNTAIAAHVASMFVKNGTLGMLVRAFKRGVTAVAVYKLGRRKGKGASGPTSVDGDDDDDDVGDADPSDFCPDE